jgi:hypothetical protein
MSYSQPPGPPFGVAPTYDMSGGQPRRTSGVAIAALISSLIICVPFLTSAIGVLLGLIGLFVAGGPRTKGRGLALAGLLIGVVGLVLWSAGTWYVVDRFYMPIQTVARFTTDLNNAPAAQLMKYVAPPMDLAKVEAVKAKLANVGALKEFIPDTSVNPGGLVQTTVDGKPAYQMIGTLEFLNVSYRGDFEIRKTAEGWRITKFDLTEVANPTTVPATTRP